MTEYPTLKNAPITEALIDIRVKLPKEFDIEKFRSIHGKISAYYPDEQVRKMWEDTIAFKKGERITTTSERIDAYRYISKDKTQIVQLRIDGFTFSKLKPYKTWEDLRDEAHRLWKMYTDIVFLKLKEYRQNTTHLKQNYLQKLSALDELKQSLLQKAFAGEL